MRIVFMGTPDFAVPSLTSLVEAGNEIALVITRPDAVRGRGKKLEPSPVKAKALELGLPVIETNRMTPEVVEALQAARADIFCVAAYGCILPDDVLHMAPLGIVNVHASLLPRWRGAAPIQRAILAGDEVAGVSIMRIGHGVDTGAYCAQASTSVAGKHAEALTMELGELGGKLLADTLPLLADGTAVWNEQDESLVTLAAKISKQEMRLDPKMAALNCVRHVLASSDTAPARCVIAGKTVRVLDAAPADVSLVEGQVLVKAKRVYLGLSDGSVELLEVKPDGKRAMAASAWAAGLQGADLSWGALEEASSVLTDGYELLGLVEFGKLQDLGFGERRHGKAPALRRGQKGINNLHVFLVKDRAGGVDELAAGSYARSSLFEHRQLQFGQLNRHILFGQAPRNLGMTTHGAGA